MKGRTLIFVTAVVATVVVAGLYAAYPRVTSTSVASIKADPTSYNGKDVSIFGTVIDRGENGFTIADGTDSIEVRWSGTLPAIGTAKVLVHGVVTGEVIQLGKIFKFEEVEIRATSVDTWQL